MKIRRITSMLIALMIVLGMFTAASAQTTQTDSYALEAYGVTLNEETNTMAVQDRETRQYTLISADGTPLTSEPYISMDPNGAMYEVAVESGVNVLGMIDSSGQLVVPMQYGDIHYLSERWQIGVALTEATAENYDYKSFGGNSFWLVSSYDVYYMGTMVGSLDRMAYYTGYARGNYLYVVNHERSYSYYDSAFNPSPYQSNFAGSSEYEEMSGGVVIHRGSGQQAFTPGCTLTSDDVELDIYEVQGNYVDLQGNVLFPVDAKYDYIADFEGEYARTNLDRKYGLIDRTGREVLPCEYDELSATGNAYFAGGYQAAVKDGKFGYLNLNGEVTCEFKYASSAVKNTYKAPVTYLTDLEGNAIVLSAAIGELPETYAEIRTSGTNGCPLFVFENKSGAVGMMDIYGQEIIPADGTYDHVYDLSMSNDGTVVVGSQGGGVYMVYLFGNDSAASDAVDQAAASIEDMLGGTTEEEPAAPEADAEVPAADSETPAADAEAPAADAGWTCSCGNVNTGKFCSECGTARPADKLVCAKCGHEPEEGTTPKFCSECGNAF